MIAVRLVAFLIVFGRRAVGELKDEGRRTGKLPTGLWLVGNVRGLLVPEASMALLISFICITIAPQSGLARHSSPPLYPHVSQSKV